MSPSCEPRLEPQALCGYAQPRLARGLLDLITSVVPYLALTVVMVLTFDTSIVPTLVLAMFTQRYLVEGLSLGAIKG